MPNQPHATGQHAVLADARAAGDPDASGHGSVITDLHVVSDLDLVIQLDPVADPGVGQRATVDSSIDADLHVITNGDAADLRNLAPDALLVGKAEALAADHGTRLDDHTLTDGHVVIQRDPRCQPTTFTDHTAGTDEAVCADADVGADARTTFDDRERPDAGAGVHLGIFRHHGAGMYSRLSLGFGIEQVGNPRVSQVRVRHDQGIAGKAFGIRSLEQHRAGLAVVQVLAVLRVGEEAQLRRTSLLQGGQPGNLQRLGPLEGSSEHLGQLA
ncbi:hypothetical protein D3C81_1350220 [compost metagenome]